MDILKKIQEDQNLELYQKLHWSGTFEEYIKKLEENPSLIQTAFDRLYSMILSYGTEERTIGKKKVTIYNFFKDLFNEKDSIYGLEISLMNLVNVFRSAALGYGTEKRIILLHGPVGSSKSTIVRLLKKGLEEYSKTDAGAVFTFMWKSTPETEDIFGPDKEFGCPMHEDPVHLVPRELRQKFYDKFSDKKLVAECELCPPCRFIFRSLMEHYNGDWSKVLNHIVVKRVVFSEKDRIGIGTFQPKDEKNQDSTELTGDINYRKLAIYGSDSDPRAFSFTGEFNIANRGIIEFIELLKLDVAFLYDLLCASQEHKIKSKNFAQTDIDLVIIGHTNGAEFRKLQSNEYMEALRDRTIKIDIPYCLKVDDEIKIYEKDFSPKNIVGKHMAPHTLEVAAMFAVLTRLKDPKNASLSLVNKMKLYNGKTIEDFNEESLDEVKEEAAGEGMEGISPRFIQDKISNALVHIESGDCINPFLVLGEFEEGLDHYSLISSGDVKKRYKEIIALVKEEYTEIVKNEIQRAMCADESALARLCNSYIENVRACVQKEKVKNVYTKQYEEADERLMRSIEEEINISESRKDEFRTQVMNYIASLTIEKKPFDYKSNERLHRALELKLFKDQKHNIKLSSAVSTVKDDDTLEKLNALKKRLKEVYGYCDTCADNVLSYVGSIIAREEKE